MESEDPLSSMPMKKEQGIKIEPEYLVLTDEISNIHSSESRTKIEEDPLSFDIDSIYEITEENSLHEINNKHSSESTTEVGKDLVSLDSDSIYEITEENSLQPNRPVRQGTESNAIACGYYVDKKTQKIKPIFTRKVSEKCLPSESSINSHMKIPSSINSHMKIPTAEKCFRSDECQRFSLHQGHLDQHERTHAEKKSSTCAVCLKSFTLSSYLKARTIIYEGDKLYTCNECLRKIPKTQTGGKLFSSPFMCAVCRKGFSQSGHLKARMITHQGDKLYTCIDCQISPRDLHNRFKPFPCGVCSKVLSTAGNLKSHMRIHTESEPVKRSNGTIKKCHYCNYATPHGTTFIRHVAMHTGEKPFKCTWCPAGFTVKSNLKMHIRGHMREW